MEYGTYCGDSKIVVNSVAHEDFSRDIPLAKIQLVLSHSEDPIVGEVITYAAGTLTRSDILPMCLFIAENLAPEFVPIPDEVKQGLFKGFDMFFKQEGSYRCTKPDLIRLGFTGASLLEIWDIPVVEVLCTVTMK